MADTDQERRRELFRQLLAQQGLDLSTDLLTGAPADESVPLSAAQQRVWFQQQLDPESSVYNLTCGVRISGEVDVDRLRRAVSELARHHTILRTTYAEDGSSQIAHDDVLPEFRVEEVPDLSEVEEKARRLARTPFDLTNESSMRVLLLRAATAEGKPPLSALIVVIHHIAADDSSWAVLFPELFCRYASEPQEDIRPTRYSDCVRWEQRALDPVRRTELVGYWRSVLEPTPPRLLLPTDRPSSTDQLAEEGGVVTTLVPSDVRERLARFAQDESATLFMAGLALTAVLLFRHTWQRDLTIGIPAVLRDRWQTQNQIGNFQNTLVIRLEMDPQLTFRELLAQVRQRCLEAYAHQDLPFEQLVAELRPGRVIGRTPWIDVLYLDHSRALAGVSCPGLALEEIVLHNGTSQFDLTFATASLDEGLELIGLHRSSVFEPETVSSLLERWVTLAAAVASDPGKRVGELPLAGEPQPERPVVTAEAKDSVLERFARMVAEHPQRPAVIDGDNQLSFDELANRGAEVAHELRRVGVVERSHVAVLAQPGISALTGLLGVTMCGAVHVPIDASQPGERILELLNRTRPAALCVAGAAVPQGWDGVVVRLDEPLPEARFDECSLARVSCDDPAYVIFTSGSTGQPKGVVVSHRNLVRLFTVTRDRFAFSPCDRWLLAHSLGFDFSVWEVWGAWLHGSALVVAPHDVRRDPDAMAELIVSGRITVLNQTPTAFFALVPTLLRYKQHSLRWIIFGGEALDPRRLRTWFNSYPNQPQIMNMYGITETTVHTTWGIITPADSADDRGLSPIGVALPDVTCDIVDATGRRLPPGAVGEILVGGAGVSLGYLNDPGLTAERFPPDPAVPAALSYRSGDLARRQWDSLREFFGRADDQLQIRGFRIETGEVEARLREHPLVTDAAVGADGDQLVGFLVAPSHADLSNVRAWLAARLPAHLVPDRLHHLDRLPMTATGKLDRGRLLGLGAPLIRRRSAASAGPESATDSQRKVIALWQELLGVDAVAPDDNFFDLGGHSLLLTRVRDELVQRTGVRLPIAEMYANPTPVALASHLDALASGAGMPASTRSEPGRVRQQREALLRRRSTGKEKRGE